MLQETADLAKELCEECGAAGFKFGIGKRKFMELEQGDSFQLMRQIKELIDPKGLMNPGKIFM